MNPDGDSFNDKRSSSVFSGHRCSSSVVCMIEGGKETEKMNKLGG